MHEYEQFARRRFFEKLLEGGMAVSDIYGEASKLNIDLTASGYNLLFFYMQEVSGTDSRMETEKFMRKQEEILHYFLCHPQYVLFSWNVNCYGVLIKAEREQVTELTERGIEQIRKVCTPEEEHINWYVAAGKPVERLSMLCDCYQGANHYFAYRFILTGQHILTEESLAGQLNGNQENEIGKVDTAKIDPEIIKEFLSRGKSGEIQDFVETYVSSIHDALESRMFRDYIILNIRFTITSYLETIGTKAEVYEMRMDAFVQDLNMKPEEVGGYFANMLKVAMEIRDEESDYQSGKVLRNTLEYVDNHYMDESLSLNSVAELVGVSANYLSAIFSQSMQKTFVEYITAKRMEMAKKLLRNTDKASGEIAAEIGYKDPHYFSFVFKKTQGMSPRDYRNGKKS